MRPKRDDLKKMITEYLEQLSDEKLRIVYQFVLHLIK